MYTHTVLSAQGLLCRLGRAIYHCGNEEEKETLGLSRLLLSIALGATLIVAIVIIISATR